MSEVARNNNEAESTPGGGLDWEEAMRKAELVRAEGDVQEKREVVAKNREELAQIKYEGQTLYEADEVFNHGGDLIDRVGFDKLIHVAAKVQQNGEGKFASRTDDKAAIWYGSGNQLVHSTWGHSKTDGVLVLDSINVAMRGLLDKPADYDFIKTVESNYVTADYHYITTPDSDVIHQRRGALTENTEISAEDRAQFPNGELRAGRTDLVGREALSEADKNMFRMLSEATGLKGDESSDPWRKLDQIAGQSNRAQRSDLVDRGKSGHDDVWATIYTREALLKDKNGHLSAREAIQELCAVADPVVVEVVRRVAPEREPGEADDVYNKRHREAVAVVMKDELTARRDAMENLQDQGMKAREDEVLAERHAEGQARYDTAEFAAIFDAIAEIGDAQAGMRKATKRGQAYRLQKNIDAQKKKLAEIYDSQQSA